MKVATSQIKKVDPLTVACGLPNINVDGNIILSVGGGDSEIQIEEDNHLKAGGEAQVEENNKFDAGGDIEIFSDSKTEIKKFTDLDAGDEIDVESNGFCKIEAVIIGEWTAGAGGIDTHACELAPSI